MIPGDGIGIDRDIDIVTTALAASHALVARPAVATCPTASDPRQEW